MNVFDETQIVFYEFEVPLCRIIGTRLVASNLNVKISVDIVEDSDIEFGLTKIEHWIETCVGNAVAVSAHNGDGFGVLLTEDGRPRLDNPLMVCPSEPTDANLGPLLQAKLEALAEGAFVIGHVELKSNSMGGLSFTFCGDYNDFLPTMENWITGPTWFDKPWWERDDASTFDTIMPEGADPSDIPSWAYDVGSVVRNQENMEGVVITTSFQPKIEE